MVKRPLTVAALVIGLSFAGTVEGRARPTEGQADPLGAAAADYDRGDYAAALAQFRALAAHGDATAMAWIGVFYDDGNGVAADQAKALS